LRAAPERILAVSTAVSEETQRCNPTELSKLHGSVDVCIAHRAEKFPLAGQSGEDVLKCQDAVLDFAACMADLSCAPREEQQAMCGALYNATHELCARFNTEQSDASLRPAARIKPPPLMIRSGIARRRATVVLSYASGERRGTRSGEVGCMPTWKKAVLGAAVGIAGLALGTSFALAKRKPPADVAAVLHEGVRYEAPPFNNGCDQNGGCVVAYDDATDAPLWQLKVYCTHYDSALEADVQDVFITSLALEDARLQVTDEHGREFSIDLQTRAVAGDARGCGAEGGGCSSSSSPRPGRGIGLAFALAVALVASLRSRAATRRARV
jgi:hypothetical protein